LKRDRINPAGNGSGGAATPVGGYDSEQPTVTTTVGPGGRVRREDTREKVMSTFKVSEETNIIDLVEIRKAIGIGKSVKGIKKK
jgi:hypothetical protein